MVLLREQINLKIRDLPQAKVKSGLSKSKHIASEVTNVMGKLFEDSAT